MMKHVMKAMSRHHTWPVETVDIYDEILMLKYALTHFNYKSRNYWENYTGTLEAKIVEFL